MLSAEKLYKYCEIWASWTLKMEAGISLEASVIIFNLHDIIPQNT